MSIMPNSTPWYSSLLLQCLLLFLGYHAHGTLFGSMIPPPSGNESTIVPFASTLPPEAIRSVLSFAFKALHSAFSCGVCFGTGS
jgi:hypothetical protein